MLLKLSYFSSNILNVCLRQVYGRLFTMKILNIFSQFENSLETNYLNQTAVR